MNKVEKMGVGVLAAALMATTLCACGGKDTADKTGSTPNQSGTSDGAGGMGKVNEDYFLWQENIITGVTEEGKKQTSVVIPARCEGFSGVVFQDTNITEVTFEDDDDVALDFAFMGAEQLVSVVLPANLTVIPTMCFESCKGLTSITIPASVTTLEGYAFKFCLALESVEFQGNQFSVIGEHSFEYCEALQAIEIPPGVTTIEEYAFANCEALESVTLGASVNTIETLAFTNTAVKELYLPEDIRLENVDAAAFGMDIYEMVVYVVEGSWSDLNREVWHGDWCKIRYQ